VNPIERRIRTSKLLIALTGFSIVGLLSIFTNLDIRKSMSAAFWRFAFVGDAYCFFSAVWMWLRAKKKSKTTGSVNAEEAKPESQD
jgi:hypothetical protein